MSRIGAKAKKGRTVKLSPERKRVLRAIVDHLVDQQRPTHLALGHPRTAGMLARAFIVAVLGAFVLYFVASAGWALWGLS